jgi:hypothetical protein
MQKTDQLEKLSVPDISVKEFDEIIGKHSFSEKYETRKKQMLKECRKKVWFMSGKSFVKAATIFICAGIVLPLGVYAAISHGDFIENMFGNTAKKNVEASVTIVDEGLKKNPIVYQKKEYVPVDIDKAEKEVGDYIVDTPITTEIEGHTLTILSTLRDSNAMLMEFTLEKKGGVTALIYDENTNAAKGAYFAEDSDFILYIEDGSDNIYVDIDKSTKDKLYCYSYVAFSKKLDENYEPKLEICKRLISDENTSEPTYEVQERLALSNKNPIPDVVYTSSAGESVTISPISLTIDMTKGLGLKGDSAMDPGSITKVQINYKDGSNYVVSDDDNNVNNTGYALGNVKGSLVNVFNRLVEMDNVKNIEINDIVYNISE